MPGNRVDRLETEVQELEATVEGLTEELVEANERIRQLEEALSADVEADSASSSTPEPTGTDAVTLADAETVESATAGGSPEGVDDDLERQFEVAEEADPEDVEAAANQVMDGGRAADTSKTEDDETEDEGDTDDIIVA